jgi:hypothetical protein
MQNTHSRADKIVQRTQVNSDPHDLYRENDPWTGEELKPGIPILKCRARGQVLRKEVIYETIKCPDCSTPARYSDDEEPLCPNCGMICSGEEVDQTIVRDAAAAGRMP